MTFVLMIAMNKLLSLLLFICISFSVQAQLKPIGSWTDHLPYKTGSSITTDGVRVFVGTETGMFSYSTQDQSIERSSKVNILNDINIKKLKYNHHNGVLLIVYTNGNIDLLQGGQISNIPFVKSKQEITNKEINEIFFIGPTAYLSFGFGIVELDTDKKEITDTYQFGPNGTEINVNSSLVLGNTVYAGTDKGFYFANTNSNLLDFNAWTKSSFKPNDRVKKLFEINGAIYSVFDTPVLDSDSVYQINSNPKIAINQLSGTDFISLFIVQGGGTNELLYLQKNKVSRFDLNLSLTSSFPRQNFKVVGAVATNNNELYIADDFAPLFRYKANSLLATIKPNGPFEKGTFDIAVSETGTLWAVPGGFDGAYNSTFNSGRIYKLKDGTWTSYKDFSSPSLSGKFDIMSIEINPLNENDVYFGTFGTGLIQHLDAPPFITLNDNNSSLQQRQDVVWNWIGAPGVKFDENNNLWVTNSYTTNCLSARINNVWYRYNFTGGIKASTAITELLITQSGNKWIALPRDNAILVFDDNNTPTVGGDDRAIILSSEEGAGNIPGIVGITMELDLDGQVWIGTTDGVAVFYNPDNVFEDGKRDAQRVLLEGGENVEILLAGTTIKDIEVDGANRKWIATEGAGVYLLSEDGKEEILHYTEDNSPLFSNSVFTIEIDQNSGEVYFGTANGIISYRGEATNGKENFSEIKIFPNPVRENYTGPIAISGLMSDTRVKITDINGLLVNELRSKGGQAIWDGTTFTGERAKTGVYLIFNSAENENQSLKTAVGKLLLVN